MMGDDLNYSPEFNETCDLYAEIERLKADNEALRAEKAELLRCVSVMRGALTHLTKCNWLLKRWQSKHWRKPMTDKIKCEICQAEDKVYLAPLMTGVPFSAPESEQRYVCSGCIHTWYSDGVTTAEKILERRGLSNDR